MGLPGSPRVTARGVSLSWPLHGRDPGAVTGFRTHLEVLKANGVCVHVAESERKTLTCNHCGT